MFFSSVPFRHSLQKHLAKMSEKIFICEFCGQNFKKIFNLKRHIERFHEKVTVVETCNICKAVFNSAEEKDKHIQNQHRPSRKFVLSESAFKKSFVHYKYIFNENETDFGRSQVGIINAIKKQFFMKLL